MAIKYPPAMMKLISLFMRFEGVGKKSAERLVFNMVSHWDDEALAEFASCIASLTTTLHSCSSCYALVEGALCPFCAQDRVRDNVLCIVASARDVYLIESTGMHKGGYFVLGTLLSPLDDRGLSQDRVEKLCTLIQHNNIKEVLLALDSSLEGDATSSYVTTILSPLGVAVSKLAFGIPVGASLDFVDRGTLSEALRGRKKIN